jgi:hypothetical protein
MGPVWEGVPLPLAMALRNRLHLRVAVETGTFRGDSAAALAPLFEQVVTIERSPELAAAAASRLRPFPNVTVIGGRSAEEILRLGATLSRPFLAWLDAHWCTGGTGTDDECPVLREIAALPLAPAAAGSCLLIDDARLFQGPPPPPHDHAAWPPLMDVIDALRRRHSRYVTLLEDVIIASPLEARKTVDDYWLGRQSETAGKRSGFPGRLRRLFRRR